jgi:hypothetical protein
VAARVTPDPILGAHLEEALTRTFGGGALELTALAAVLLTWTLYRRGAAQRFATLVPLAVFATVLNPYASALVSRNMTGPSYWRALWILPAPILLALMLGAPLQRRGRRAARIAGAAVAVAATAGFVALVPPYSSLSRRNRVFFGWLPKLKVTAVDYEVARQLSRRAPEGSMVVAPQKIALRLIGFHHHPYVTYAREVYLQRIDAEIGHEEAALRMRLSDIVSQPSVDIELRIRESEDYPHRAAAPEAIRTFESGLERLDVRAVCLNRNAPLVAQVREALRELGFRPEVALFGYQIWTRAGGLASPAAREATAWNLDPGR